MKLLLQGMIIGTVLIFIAVLGLLVFVHELGHFVVAKRAGMKIEEFGFGFPPRLFGIKIGETVYSINWIPLGGFVKITGEDPGTEGAEDPRSFQNQSFGARLAVLLAGVAMNFLLAWFLFFIGFWLVGTPVEITPGIDLTGASLSEKELAIAQVLPDSPAEVAGFKSGDVIVSVDGVVITDIEVLINYNKDRAGSDVVYQLRRGSEVFDLSVVPRANPPENSGPVGFAPAIVALVKYPLFQSISISFFAFIDRVGAIFGAFGLLFSQLFTSGRIIESLAGPVGIAVLTRDFAQLGLAYLLQFTAVLSINLAIINAAPFPALDGGRVVFLAIEKIRGVKSLKWEQVANAVGFSLLILLMVLVTARDFSRYSDQFKRLFETIL